jgi:hypothetical protein
MRNDGALGDSNTHELKTILTMPLREFSRSKTHVVIPNPRQRTRAVISA